MTSAKWVTTSALCLGGFFFFFGRGVLGGFCWFSRLRRSHQDPKTQFSREQEDFM